jgi:non-ribosomal peptide synthetase component E (peptide arylation enzyme)
MTVLPIKNMAITGGIQHFQTHPNDSATFYKKRCYWRRLPFNMLLFQAPTSMEEA